MRVQDRLRLVPATEFVSSAYALADVCSYDCSYAISHVTHTSCTVLYWIRLLDVCFVV